MRRARSSPILACIRVYIHLCLWFGLVLAKNVDRTLLQPRLPVRDLVWVDIELLGRLGESLVSLQGGQGHFALKVAV
jgi:hypothetical protein